MPYVIRCCLMVSFTDTPSQPEGLTATPINTGSVLLSWNPPINNSQCVVGYIINSTLTNSIIYIPNQLTYSISPEGGVVTSCTYTASVAANDTVGRIGDWSEGVNFSALGMWCGNHLNCYKQLF